MAQSKMQIIILFNNDCWKRDTDIWTLGRQNWGQKLAFRVSIGRMSQTANDWLETSLHISYWKFECHKSFLIGVKRDINQSLTKDFSEFFEIGKLKENNTSTGEEYQYQPSLELGNK